jgi:prepilin-type N-terminal cleavage/methylation domain-containing protein
MRNQHQASFSLMELLIVIAIVALVAAAAFALLNPKRQIEKAWNSKRKNELNLLKKVLEEWYNDKNCYPDGQKICYDWDPSITDTQGNPYCHICGTEASNPADLSSYLPRAPCDPEHPNKEYLYSYENSSCPKWYRVYTKLSAPDRFTVDDQDSIDVGCRYYGCGIYLGSTTGSYGYSYGVSSPNVDLERATTYRYCSDGCDVCGQGNDPFACTDFEPNLLCNGKLDIYPTLELCDTNCPCRH